MLDRYSRGVVAFQVYLRPPNARQMTALLSRAERRAGRSPKSPSPTTASSFRTSTELGAKPGVCAPATAPSKLAAALPQSSSASARSRPSTSASSSCPSTSPPWSENFAAYFSWYHLHQPHQGLGGLVPADRWSGVERGGKTTRTRGPRRSKKKRKRHRIEVEIFPFEGGRQRPVVQLRRAA